MKHTLATLSRLEEKGCCQGFLGHLVRAAPLLDWVGDTVMLQKLPQVQAVKAMWDVQALLCPGARLHLQGTPSPACPVVPKKLAPESVGDNDSCYSSGASSVSTIRRSFCFSLTLIL